MATEQLVTVETLKSITDAFNRHDRDAIMEFFAEDSSSDMPRAPDPWDGGLPARSRCVKGFPPGLLESQTSTTETTATGSAEIWESPNGH